MTDAEQPKDYVDVRSHNVGESDYATKTIQPWDILIEYDIIVFLNSLSGTKYEPEKIKRAIEIQSSNWDIRVEKENI